MQDRERPSYAPRVEPRTEIDLADPLDPRPTPSLTLWAAQLQTPEQTARARFARQIEATVLRDLSARAH